MKDLIPEFLLNKNKIDKQDVYLILEKMIDKKPDFGDIYFQSKMSESWILEKKIIKKGEYNFDEGFGIRIVKNQSTSFSYSNCIDLKNLHNVSNTVFNMLPQKSSGTLFKKNNFPKHEILYNFDNPLNTFAMTQKVDILHKIDFFARKEDKRVVDVCIELTNIFEKILIFSTDQVNFTFDYRPLIHLSITVFVEENGKREQGRSGGGGRSDLNYLFQCKDSGEMLFEYWAKEAVRIALISLSAKLAPAGTFPVVLAPGWPGILFHEAVGHGLEGDFIRKKTSVFTEKIGTKVASSLCNLVDNGTLKQLRGSIHIDDEGVISKYNLLIKNGILKSFLQDKLNAHLTCSNLTGNGRRQSYAYLPMPRMTNTYLLPGNHSAEEIISSVDYGIYAVNFNGGQVDITSGNFVFSASEAYVLKNGKITFPIKGVMLIGSGSTTMKYISMVGNDLKMDDGMGSCGKDGQNIPVCVGQPTIKVDKLTVGGNK